ncbi:MULTISPECIES: PoNe immunity protein domain-containing protein [unclassified Agarivorans]|uniref:PoNe immunity protein domain-containing protein n=1 Tax=unclassified Agarivorans TaxID=2636026 RepID=UPI003D7C4AA1
MIRDTNKSKEYFEELVDYSQESIKKRALKLSSQAELGVSTKLNLSFRLLTNHIVLMQERYSLGDDLSEFEYLLEMAIEYRRKQKQFADALPSNEQKDRIGWEEIREDYLADIFLKWLSFAYCLDMGQAYYQEVLDLIGNQGRDALFDNIAVRLGDTEREVAESVLFKRRFNKLFKVIEAEPAERPKLMLAYLDAWYKLEGSPDYHLMDGEAYDGYWCWEAALITKLYEIDDRLYIDHQYYPKDLVHWSEQ